MSTFYKVKLWSLLFRRAHISFCLFAPSSKVLQEAQAPAKSRSVARIFCESGDDL